MIVLKAVHSFKSKWCSLGTKLHTTWKCVIFQEFFVPFSINSMYCIALHSVENACLESGTFKSPRPDQSWKRCNLSRAELKKEKRKRRKTKFYKHPKVQVRTYALTSTMKENETSLWNKLGSYQYLTFNDRLFPAFEKSIWASVLAIERQHDNITWQKGGRRYLSGKYLPRFDSILVFLCLCET